MTKPTHHIHCAESSEDIRSVIYDPNGNAMTHGELCDIFNEMQDNLQTLKDVLANIRDSEKWHTGHSSHYMEGYRDCEQHFQEIAELGLSAVNAAESKYADPRDDPDYREFVGEMESRCRCSRGVVCDGVLAGGPCDDIQEDERGDEYEDD